MSTITVWLLIAFGAAGSGATTIAKFKTLTDCEATRTEAVEKIPMFYQRSTGCVKANILAAQAKEQ